MTMAAGFGRQNLVRGESCAVVGDLSKMYGKVDFSTEVYVRTVLYNGEMNSRLIPFIFFVR